MSKHGDLLTSPQVAQRLRCSPRTVHRLITSGDLTPVHKLPGHNGAHLFTSADVEALAAARGLSEDTAA